MALSEPVDVHLGLGFPLRLYPLGGAEQAAVLRGVSACHRRWIAG
jgi:hypothetical protein